jgi:hypothetical protein
LEFERLRRGEVVELDGVVEEGGCELEKGEGGGGEGGERREVGVREDLEEELGWEARIVGRRRLG